jgi:hypothetical protein
VRDRSSTDTGLIIATARERKAYKIAQTLAMLVIGNDPSIDRQNALAAAAKAAAHYDELVWAWVYQLAEVRPSTGPDRGAHTRALAVDMLAASSREAARCPFCPIELRRPFWHEGECQER